MDKIRAFYGSMEAYEEIPAWDQNMPSLNPDLAFRKLDHGYDESKEKPGLADLQEAAVFRGGKLKAESWDGQMHTPLKWKCCLGHSLTMTPHAVLKGGHWCLDCISPPWNYESVARKNLFAAQVIHPSK
jgi:hypothetical protein